MRAWNEEIFGPVAPVMTFSDEDEAVAIANDTEYGLSGAVYTSSHERGRELADRLDTGLVHIMGLPCHTIRWRRSAAGSLRNGAASAAASASRSSPRRWITEQPEPASYPF